jgi:hypothetical protein
MNNYLKILNYLKQFDADGDYHDLNSVFEEAFNISTLNETVNKFLLNSDKEEQLALSNDRRKKFKKFLRVIELLEEDGLIKSKTGGHVELTSNPSEGYQLPRQFRRNVYYGGSIWSRFFGKKYLRVVTSSVAAQITPLGVKYLKEMLNTSTNSVSSTSPNNNHLISLSKDLIKKGQIRLSIDSLFKLDLKEDHREILFMILGKLSFIESEEEKGTISNEEKSIARNKATEELLGVINQIQKYIYSA